MSNSAFIPKTKKIQIVGKEFEIKPFVIRTRTKFLKIVFDIFRELSEKRSELKLDNIQTRNVAQLVPVLAEAAGERLIDIYELVISEPREWMIDNVQIKDEIAIIEAILEVNDISFLVSQVKNIGQQVKKLQ